MPSKGSTITFWENNTWATQDFEAPSTKLWTKRKRRERTERRKWMTGESIEKMKKRLKWTKRKREAAKTLKMTGRNEMEVVSVVTDLEVAIEEVPDENRHAVVKEDVAVANEVQLVVVVVLATPKVRSDAEAGPVTLAVRETTTGDVAVGVAIVMSDAKNRRGRKVAKNNVHRNVAQEVAAEAVRFPRRNRPLETQLKIIITRRRKSKANVEIRKTKQL
jgi:hypothetical protein